ncbi:MAG: membrane protein insertase YidC [Acidobacteria bacterium]|nr:membrane protein insertase YidC [Acidobacteriota bacterium]MCI0620428.1 membrane protein insertase YidC [Acidobacteriota bacterium]MCI0719201.1 membrane protein insertase YidC [Acidobacteriota bacterium]
MERRILLALALSFLLITLTRPLWESQRPSQPPSGGKEASKEINQEQPKEAPIAPKKIAPVEAPAVESKQADAERWIEIETDLFRVKLSNREAVVHSWVLKKYSDSHGKPLEFVDEKKSVRYGYPLSIRIDKEEELMKSLRTALYAVEAPSRMDLTLASSLVQHVLFEYADQNLRVSKKLTFTNGSYVVGVDSKAWVNGRPAGHYLDWSSGFGDATVDPRMAVHRAIYRTGGKITRLMDSDVGQEQEHSGSFDFAGLEDLYFAALFLPSQGEVIRRIQLSQNEHDAGEGKKEKLLRAAVFNNSLESQGTLLFVGPKDTEVLKKTGPHLAEVIDYGWFGVVCEPLFLALKWIHSYVRNYGVAIVVLTLLINVALFPLKYKSIVSAQKMQKLQPQMKAIQEKFKRLKPTDPKRQQMNAEVMALYKEHGVNPLGGCLPLLLQMPFFIAFYNLLSVSIELRHAPFILWIKDLSAADHTYILPILMTVTMVIMQKMTPTPTADPVQAKIMLAMPVFFGFMLAFTSSGLVLYWLTSNVAGILQQYFMNKYGPGTAAEAPVKRGKKK